MNDYKEDIEILVEKLEEIHPDLYRNYTKENFYKDIDKLKKDSYNMRQDEFKCSLARVLAKLKDGHTTITFYTNMLFELKYLDGKLYIVEDYKNNKSRYKYKYITNINGVNISNIINKVLECIPNETNSWLFYVLETELLSKELLKGLEIVTEEQFLITLNDGTIIDYYQELKKKNIKNKQYFKNEILQEGIYYVKYSRCNPIGNLNLNNWFDNIIVDIRKNNIELLIVDLRGNTGGNSGFFNEFTKKLKSEFRDMSYITLVDKGVFSSGVFALNDMINLNSITIGTCIGTTMNHFGFTTCLHLANSGINLTCSNSEWILNEGKFRRLRKEDILKLKNKSNLYERKLFIPDILVQETIEEYENDIDPYLKEAICYFNKSKKHLKFN